MDKKLGLRELINKMLITSLVLAIAAFLTPRFSIRGIGPLLTASLLISIIDFLLQSFTNFKASPFGRGLVGFLVSVIILKLVNNIVTGFNITTMGAVWGSLAIGIIDMIIPGRNF